MNSLKMQMILMDRGINDLYRMRDYLAAGGSEQTMYQLFNTQLYFPDGIIPGEEGFIETLKNAWKWLKEKVKAIVDTILSCFGIKRSSNSNKSVASTNQVSASSNSKPDESTVSEATQPPTGLNIDTEKVNKLKSEIYKATDLITKDYATVIKYAGVNDHNELKQLSDELERLVHYDKNKAVQFPDFNGKLIVSLNALSDMMSMFVRERNGLSFGGSLYSSMVEYAKQVDASHVSFLIRQLYLFMDCVETTKKILAKDATDTDKVLNFDSDNPNQIVKATEQVMEFVDTALRYAEAIPKYFNISSADSKSMWKDFEPAVKNTIELTKTAIATLKNNN